MSNTITAYFKGRIGVAESVYQNDYGIVMAFDSIDLPAHFDCYFSRLNQEEALPGLGADNRVTIPNSILANPGNVTIHIPLHTGEDDSEVEYVIYFKVIGRARPIDDGTPTQMTAIERALALLSQPITNIEEIVNEALSFTGDTFAEMKQELQDDFDNYTETLEGDLATWKGGVESDIDDVEADFAVLQGQFDTAVAAVTTDTEVTDIRVGADGITYTTAGEAVRAQFSDSRDDLESEQDDGLYHRYLSWEHGGIDNATGENNNEGSLVRSRMPEYLLCADYETITIDSSDTAYVIYYKADKSFKDSAALRTDTSPVVINKNATYFRLDMRASLDMTYHIRLYQKTNLTLFKDTIQKEIATQIYFYQNRAFIEEDPTNKKVFFSAPYELYVRYGKDGTAKAVKNLNMSGLAGELNVSLVTSTRGITNCIAINDEYALVYDTSSNTFAIVHRNSVTSDYVPVIVQNGGYITYAHSSVSALLQPNRANTYAQVYFQLDEGDVEEDVNDKKVYFHAKHNVSLRYGANGGALAGKDVSMANLATELGVSLVTSPNGIADCIAINDEYALAFDISTQKFVLVHRFNLTNNQIPLIVQNGGFITYASSYFLKKLGLRGGGDKPTPDAVIPPYWYSALAEAELSINNFLVADENSASFGFVTDTHIGLNKGYSGVLLDRVMKDCHIPVWFHGGDVVSGNGIISATSLVGEMNADFAQFSLVENLGLRAVGNHEPAYGIDNNYDSNLTNAEINHYYHGVDREKFLQVYGNEKGYFYKDIHKDKLRCICLDIIPYESQIDSSHKVTGVNKLYYHQFGSEQLAWFADVLESTPNDYSVIVCSHIAPVSLAELKTLDNEWNESVPIDYLQARKIAEAYALKSAYSFNGAITGDATGDSYNIDVDFASTHGEFICFFCGHTHKDFMLQLDNVNIVGTANDSFPRSVNASSYAPVKTASTNTEQIMDFFCIIPSARTVKVVRLGAYLEANGKVRTFTY